MPLLTQEQIAERIALYQALSDAIARLAEVEAAMPVEFVDGEFHLDFECSGFPTARVANETIRRTKFVIQRTWGALRKAVLADAEKELADAEAAVLKFEAGEETDAPK